MWTLLKQSPRAGKGTIEKCIIVCPSSLVRNWANEFGTDSIPLGQLIEPNIFLYLSEVARSRNDCCLGGRRQGNETRIDRES